MIGITQLDLEIIALYIIDHPHKDIVEFIQQQYSCTYLMARTIYVRALNIAMELQK